MTEEEAKAWIAAHVPRGTWLLLSRFVELLLAESRRQNLISPASQDHVWSRHIVDSAQLCAHAPAGRWLDIGSGAGFPGLVGSIVSVRRVTLVEPRARRAAFLADTAHALGLGDRIEVVQDRVERLDRPAFDVISARAVAPLAELFAAAGGLATSATVWLLPKGRTAATELEATRASWQGTFRMLPSITDPESAIIVASHVRRRSAR